jgi:hypothetical protein
MIDLSIKIQQLGPTTALSDSLLRPDLIATSATLNIEDTLRALQITLPDSASTLPPDFDIAKLSLNTKQQFLLDKIIEKFQKLNQAELSDDQKKELTIQIINSFFIIDPTEKCKLSQEELFNHKFSEIIFIYQPSNSRFPFKLFNKNHLIILLNQEQIHSREIYDPPTNKDFILFFEADPKANFQLFSINFLDCLEYKKLLKNAIRGNFGDLNSKIYLLLNNKENDIFYKLIENPHPYNSSGNPFLYLAIEHSNLEVFNNFLISNFLSHIAVINQAIFKYNSLKEIKSHLQDKSLQIIDVLLARFSVQILKAPRYGGSIDIKLIDMKSNYSQGLTPLKYAITNNLENVIIKLIKTGAYIVVEDHLPDIISKDLLESFKVTYYLKKLNLVQHLFSSSDLLNTGRINVFQFCVMQNKLEFIKFLLSVDENLIQSLTSKGLNIIELSARYCNMEIFNYLKEKFIESKPKGYKEGELIATESASRIICLSLLNNENFNVCQYLIQHLFETRKIFYDDPDYSPLIYAISSKNLTLEKIKLLITYGLNLETELLKENRLAIFLSLGSKDLNVIKFFFNYLFQIKNGDLSKIFDIFNKSNVLTESEDIDQLLFFHEEFHSEIIKKLNAILNIEFDSESLLKIEIEKNREFLYFFRIIYSIKYDINLIETFEDYNPENEVKKNNEDEAKRILQEYAKIYDKEGSDYSILLLSGIFNDWRLLKFLIKNGSKIDKKTPNGFTIFHLALLKADYKSIKYLIEKFNEQQISIFTSTDNRYNPINLLAKNPNLSLEEFKEIFEILKQQSSTQFADPNQADPDGNSILHNALNFYKIKLQNYDYDYDYRYIPDIHEEKFEEGDSFEEKESQKSQIARFNKLLTYQISIADPQSINEKNKEGKSIFELAIEFTMQSKSNDIVFKLLEFENIEIPDQLPKVNAQEEKLDEKLSKKILACKINKIINDKNIDDSEETSNEAIANKIANFITVNNLHFLEEVGDDLGIKIIESSHDNMEEKVVIIPKEISAILRENQISKPSATQELDLLTVDSEFDKEPSTSTQSSGQAVGSQLGKRTHQEMAELK